MKKILLIFIGLLFISYYFYDDVVRDISKHYIIKNHEQIKRYNNSQSVYLELKTNSSYYEYITISQHADSSYNCIIWGNRDSKLFYILKDTQFFVDIEYNRYKGKSVKQDIKIIELIKNK